MKSVAERMVAARPEHLSASRLRPSPSKALREGEALKCEEELEFAAPAHCWGAGKVAGASHSRVITPHYDCLKLH